MKVTLETVMREYAKQLPLEDQLVVSVFHAKCKQALAERQAEEQSEQGACEVVDFERGWILK